MPNCETIYLKFVFAVHSINIWMSVEDQSISWVFAKWISPLQSVGLSEWLSELCWKWKLFVKIALRQHWLGLFIRSNAIILVRDDATVVRFSMSAVGVVGSICLVSKSYFFAVNLIFPAKLLYQGIYFSTLFHLRVYDGCVIFLGFLLCFCCFFCR